MIDFKKLQEDFLMCSLGEGEGGVVYCISPSVPPSLPFRGVVQNPTLAHENTREHIGRPEFAFPVRHIR